MTKLIEQILETDWACLFDRRTFERGMHYAEQARVTVLKVGDSAIYASCRGSGRNVYEQVIEFKDTGGEFFLGTRCTCPMVRDCKHCAAVLNHLEDHYSNLDDSAPDQPLNPELERWLNSVPAMTPQVETFAKGNTTRLLYKLQTEVMSGKYSLGVFKARQLKDGQLTDVKPLYSLDEILARPPAYMLELDKRIARLLLRGRSYHYQQSSYPLEGYAGVEILELALSSLRLFFEGFDSGELLRSGSARAAQFGWSERPDGQYHGQWQSAGHVLNYVLPLEPLYYLDTARMELGLLEHDFDKKLAIHMCHLPYIPARQVAQFSHRIGAVAATVPPPQALTERVIDGVEPGSRYMQFGFQHRAALLDPCPCASPGGLECRVA